MNEINRQGIYYAQQIDLRFPKCCRIIVKRLSSHPGLLNKKLEISGTRSVQTVHHCEPFLVDLLNPESDGFKQHQITPGMLNVFYSVVNYLRNCIACIYCAITGSAIILKLQP